MPYEIRQYNFEIRARENDGIGILSGRPVIYNSRTNLGEFDEIIMPGALDETDLKDVRFLVNHDTKMIPLARSRRNNGNSTMTLKVTDQGLELEEARLDIRNNTTAAALYSAVSRGDISGMSFMFVIDGEEWEDLETDHPLRKITKIATLIEISAVMFPAYEDTDINARSKAALESARSALEKARQQRANAVETAGRELELLKLRTKRLI